MAASAGRTLSVRAADISCLSGIAFLALLVLIHVVRPDVSPNWQTTSEYARGGLGWLMVVAFLLSAVGYGALAAAVLARRRRVLARNGAVILAIAAVGTVVGGVFVTDPIDTPQDQLSNSAGKNPLRHIVSARGHGTNLPRSLPHAVRNHDARSRPSLTARPSHYRAETVKSRARRSSPSRSASSALTASSSTSLSS